MSIIDKIKKIVQKYEDIQVPTYTLTDGTVISIDKLEVGGMVLLTDGAIPPAGDHTLDDGTVITVDETGKILAVATPLSAEAMSLLDGTSITITALEVGGSVMLNGEPAKEGSYTFSDNTVITVDAMGVITSVTPPSVEVEEPMDFAAQFETLKNEFQNSIQGLVEQAVTTALSSSKQNYAKVEKENGELKALFAEILSVVQELAKEPATELPEKKVRMSLQDPNRKTSQLERLANAAQNFKK